MKEFKKLKASIFLALKSINRIIDFEEIKIKYE